MAEYWVSVSCSFIQKIKANTPEEAVKKAEKTYKWGRGSFPREYVEVAIEDIDFTWRADNG